MYFKYFIIFKLIYIKILLKIFMLSIHYFIVIAHSYPMV